MDGIAIRDTDKRQQNIESIKFRKVLLSQFSEQDQLAFTDELRKRAVSYRWDQTTGTLFFDSRYEKMVKDLLP